MSADRWQQAKDALAARRAKVEAGTPGPWLWNMADDFHDDAAGWIGHDRTGDGFQEFVAQTSNHPDGLDDGALIVAAVNDYSPLLDIAEGVLDRHAPDPDPIELMLHMEEECPTGECETGDGHTVIACRGCYPSWDGMEAHTVWPCPDVRPILDWLEVGE